jgi:DNA relaxase NicK
MSNNVNNIGNRCNIDWLEFSVFNVTLDDLMYQLEFTDFVFEEGRSFYYEKLLNFDNMLYVYEGIKGNSNKQHIHVKITGKGCRFLEQYYNCKNLRDEMQGRLILNDVKVSRMDICYDYSKKFVKYLFDSVLHYGFTGYRSRKIIVEDSVTLYLGSKKSDKFIRMYEKDLESKDGRYKDRIEIVLKNQYATFEFFSTENIENILFSYMSQVTFLDEKSQKIWDSLKLGDSSPISPGLKHIKTSLEEKVCYILNTFGATLRAYCENYNNGSQVVQKYINDSIYSQKTIAMIKQLDKLKMLKYRRKISKQIRDSLSHAWFRYDFEQALIK